MNFKLLIIIIFSLTLLSTGCSDSGGSSDNVPADDGGSNSGNSDNNDPTDDPNDDGLISSSSFSIDESDFADTSNFIKIEGKANNPVVEFQAVDQSLQITTSQLDSSGPINIESEYRYPTSLSKAEIEASAGQPLFIDGIFAGIIDKYEAGAIVVRNASSFQEAFQSFNVEASNDEIVESISRSVQSAFGAYDHLNEQPLKITFKQKEIINQQRGIQQEPVIVIEFPKNYSIPLQRVEPRSDSGNSASVDCTVAEAMCDAELNINRQYGKDFGESTSFGSIEFSTEGSKIEIGLGSYIHAKYDYNVAQNNEYYFEFRPTAYYLVNIEAKVGGSGGITGAEHTFDIVDNGLDIKIPLPKGAFLNLNLKPEFVIGMEDAPNIKEAKFEARLNSHKTGFVKLSYDSDSGAHFTKDIIEKAEPLLKAGITMSIDTNKHEIVGYIFPQIAVRPQLGFLKIDKKVNLAYVRNGARADTKLKGKISEEWVLENTELTRDSEKDAHLITELYGLIDFKWDLKVGDKDIYSSDNWTVLFKSDSTLKILEWYSKILPAPEINVVAQADSDRIVSFSVPTSVPTDFKDALRYYYTTNQGISAPDEIDDQVILDSRDNTPYEIWRAGDDTLRFPEDTGINVRAVAFTDELASTQNTLWTWGMSITMQTEGAAAYLLPPSLNILGKEFDESFTVTASQAADGNDIEVDKFGIGSYQPCGSPCTLQITESSTPTFRAVKEINGKDYYSTIIAGNYRKCGENQGIQDGKCIDECPFLWDIDYQQSTVSVYSSEEDKSHPSKYKGSARIQDVLIYPRCDFIMSEVLEEKCAPYLSPPTDGSNKSGQYHLTYWDYRFADDGITKIWFQEIEEGDAELSMTYPGSSPSGLCFRDNYPEMPLKWLPSDYEDYSLDMNSYPEQEGDSYQVTGPDHTHDAVPSFHTSFLPAQDAVTSPEIHPVIEDIFGEVIKGQQFAISNNIGTYTFTPKKFKAQDFGDTFCLLNPGFCIDKGLPPNAFCTIYPDYCSDKGVDYTPISVNPGGNGDTPSTCGSSSSPEYQDWESGLWQLTATLDMPTTDNGSIVVKNFEINLVPTSDENCEFIFVDDNTPPDVVYGGALTVDNDSSGEPNLTPLSMYTDNFIHHAQVMEFNGLYTGLPVDEQGGSGLYSMQTSCSGVMPANSIADIYDKKKLEWSSPGNQSGANWATCTFTLEPMPDN